MAKNETWFSVVTFGSPVVVIPRVTQNFSRAMTAAQAAKGSGSCSDARVYACDSKTLAESADISEIRAGERVVFHA